MDQYLMWMKSKNSYSESHFQASFNRSWEEKAFSEDAACPPGGFIWPPKSYLCSFCRREFRSAQALGGHMNVHRRDRARLKQYSISPQSEDLHHQNPSKSFSKSLGTQYPSRDVFPSSDSNNSTFLASSLSFSRVSALEKFSEHTSMFPFSSSHIQEHPKEVPNYLTQSLSDSEAVRVFSTISESKVVFEKNTKKEESKSILLGDDDKVETIFFVGMNRVDSNNRQGESDETIGHKRRKSNEQSSHFILKSCSSERYPFQSEAISIKTNSMEDIDLELRLGDSPAV